MSPAARGVLALGLVLGAGGFTLMFVPDWLHNDFGLHPPAETMWLRVFGTLLVDVAYYCVRAARCSDGCSTPSPFGPVGSLPK